MKTKILLAVIKGYELGLEEARLILKNKPVANKKNLLTKMNKIVKEIYDNR